MLHAVIHSIFCGFGPACHHTASNEFSYAWKYEICDISDIDGIERSDPSCRRVDRKQKLSPPDSPELEGCDSCDHGQYDELPSACPQPLHEIVPFYFPERKIKQQGCDSCRNEVFQCLGYLFIHVGMLILISAHKFIQLFANFACFHKQ